jgi:signal transduction histidine kinase
MVMKRKASPWASYIIALIGVLISLFLSNLFWNNLLYIEQIASLKHLLLTFALLFGISLSLLSGVVIRIAQLARQRAVSLNKMNLSLKKEVEERINTEEAKQKLEIALLQGQKLQAMGTLAGGIAHDFNNILYAIIGYVEIVRGDLNKEALEYKNLGKVLEGAHRGQELISRILSFSRRQHQEFQVINLKTTIESALGLLRPTIPASVSIKFEAEANVTISGDQTQIHQVLVNLINNSVDATDGEGNITIRLTSLNSNDPLNNQFKHQVEQSYCKITITDTGRGMDQPTMERIFEPFYTTKEVGKGTGLGLSIVHSIIQEHQGEIMVNSQLGQGTTFTILLPKLAS